MKRVVFMFLIAFSTAAWADDKQDQRNVYDVLREGPQPSAGVTVDEQVTAWIKADMASLLYPVDMSSFVRPEKDAKFRDVIMLLQKQMGAQPTGIMTSNEYDRLAQAARDLEDRPIGLAPQFVSMAKDGSWVSASGTVEVGGSHRINHTRIICVRANGTCDMYSASFDPKISFLWLDLPPDPYVIKVWTSHTIMAVSEGACGVASITINVPTETVAIVDHGNCIDKTPSTSGLIDGKAVAWKIYQGARACL